MKVSYNFVSLVALGNFNPAIVSPGFLKTTLDLGPWEPIESLSQEFPFLRSFKFENLGLTVDLSRVNIQESGIKDISEARAAKIFRTYHNKLPYTPLTAVGVNINCELVPDTKTKIVSLTEKLQKPNTYLNFLGVNEATVSEQSVYGKTREKTWIGSDFVIPNVGNIARRVTVRKTKTDSFNLNYNCEAGNLKQDISKLELLLNGYDQFCKEVWGFIKYLED